MFRNRVDTKHHCDQNSGAKFAQWKKKRQVKGLRREKLEQILKYEKALVVQDNLINEYNSFKDPRVPSIEALRKIKSNAHMA